METNNKKTSIFISIFLIVILGYFALGLYATRNQSQPQAQPQPVSKNAPTPTLALSEVFSYKGQTGKNAMQLLKEKAKVEQDGSGLVTTINSRKANSSNREYWAFYVNGKLSNVGAEQYQSQDGDQLDWKIEKF